MLPASIFKTPFYYIYNYNYILLYLYKKSFDLCTNAFSQYVVLDYLRNNDLSEVIKSKTKTYKTRKGSILKSKIELEIKEIENTKSEYLIAMLTGDLTKGRFNSFYSKQIEKEKAKAIVENLTSYLSLYSNWKLFYVEPNFLKNAVEIYSKDKELKYFEGDYGNDTATIILTKNNGYLLLTNGID